MPAIDEARQQACREIRSILGEEVKEDIIDNGCLEITRESGAVLDVATFSQAAKLRLQESAA